MAGMQDRYEALAGVVVAALQRAGAPARVGELPGEWCPGSWSVIAGTAKAGGLAQRVIKGAAWAEAVIVVSGARALAAALDRVQRALEIPWDPDTLSDLPGVSPAQVREGLIVELEARHPRVRRSPLPPEILTRAAELRAGHTL